MKIKVCGLTTPADALACVAAGVDTIGLNFHPRSPRFVDIANAIRVVDALRGQSEPVGLFVDVAPASIIETARAVGLEIIQLHGDEPPEVLAELAGLRVIKAFRLAGPETLDAITAYLDRAEQLGHPPFAILVDAHVPGLAGGTGQAIGDELLSRLPTHSRLILAGGLTPENVADRIGRAQPRPWMVDVASGVESSPGIKNPERIEAFARAIRP